MTATVTLSTTTLFDGVNGSDTRIKVTSTTGMVYGTRLYVGGELMKVLRLDVDPWIVVARGHDGTVAVPHSSGDVIYIGSAEQFYFTPPVGRPDAATLVSPYIDAIHGKIYFAQGDASTTSARWWQEETTTRGTGPLGVRTTTTDPTSST